MKKIFSKIIAGISAVSILSTLSVSSFTTFALRYPEYDLDNEAYIEFLDTHTTKILEGEEEFIKYSNISRRVNSFLGWTYTVGEVKHIYYSNITPEEHIKECCLESCIIEFEYFDGTRTFVQGDIYTYGLDYHVADNLSDEELEAFNSKISDFLLENNYKAHLETSDQTVYNDPATVIRDKDIVYDKDATVEDVFNILAALYKEFDDFRVNMYFLASSLPKFTDDEEHTTTEPTTAVTFGTPTIAGDVDMNGESGMADITKLAKYTSNAELFPITDPTALANADVTQDGVIDSLDTNMLIEIALGTYESAV